MYFTFGQIERLLSGSQVGSLGTFPILPKKDRDRWCTALSSGQEKATMADDLKFDWEQVTMSIFCSCVTS